MMTSCCCQVTTSGCKNLCHNPLLKMLSCWPELALLSSYWPWRCMAGVTGRCVPSPVLPFSNFVPWPSRRSFPMILCLCNPAPPIMSFGVPSFLPPSLPPSLPRSLPSFGGRMSRSFVLIPLRCNFPRERRSETSDSGWEIRDPETHSIPTHFWGAAGALCRHDMMGMGYADLAHPAPFFGEGKSDIRPYPPGIVQASPA